MRVPNARAGVGTLVILARLGCLVAGGLIWPAGSRSRENLTVEGGIPYRWFHPHEATDVLTK
jgi:hypothetical protein